MTMETIVAHLLVGVGIVLLIWFVAKLAGKKTSDYFDPEDMFDD